MADAAFPSAGSPGDVRAAKAPEEYLTVDSLTVGYEGEALIADVEMHVRRGDVLSLIGPNGAGKSTILKTLSAYLEPIAGVVRLGGDPIDRLAAKTRAQRMSVVLTSHPNTELLTCQDIVEMGRYPYTGGFGKLSDDDKAVVEETMELSNVWDIRHRDFMQISDGQRQRVLLARAICQAPDVIVLDEPTSYLDVRYQVELLGILRSLAKRKRIAVIMSLHELDMAQKISDFVMCVKGDRVFRYGTPGEIFTQELIEELYDLDKGSYNPLFGSVELQRPQGAPRVFVIAGNGRGIEAFRALQQRNVPFATGVLHENDVDYALACDLASEVVAETAFEPIGDAALAKAKAALAGCEAVIAALERFGTINARNAELLDAARSAGIPVVRSADELPLS